MSMSSYDKYQQYMAEAEARRIANGGQTYTPTDYQAEGTAPGGGVGGILPLGVNLATREAVKRLLGEKAKEEVVKQATAQGLQTSGATQLGASSAQTMAPELTNLGAPAAPTPTPFGFVDGAGLTVAAINGLDALKNLRNGDRGGKIEGGTTAAGTALGYYLGGPVGAGIGSVIGRTTGRGLAHVFGGGVTKREQGNNTSALLNQGFTEEQLAGRLNPDKSDPNYKKVPTEAAMHDPSAMWGTYGLQSTFGPDYLNKFSEKDRWAVTQAAIENGLLKGKKGDIIVTDQDKLRSLADAAKGNAGYADSYNKWLSQRSAPSTLDTYVDRDPNVATKEMISRVFGKDYPMLAQPIRIINASPGSTTSTKFAADIAKPAAQPLGKSERLAKFRQEKMYD